MRTIPLEGGRLLIELRRLKVRRHFQLLLAHGTVEDRLMALTLNPGRFAPRDGNQFVANAEDTAHGQHHTHDLAVFLFHQEIIDVPTSLPS